MQSLNRSRHLRKLTVRTERGTIRLRSFATSNAKVFMMVSKAHARITTIIADRTSIIAMSIVIRMFQTAPRPITAMVFAVATK